MDLSGSKFYYSKLTDGEKNIYNKISDMLIRFEPTIALHAGMGKDFIIDTKKIVEAVLFDNPVFFYVSKEKLIIKQTPMYIQIYFKYICEKNEAEELWAKIENKISEFIKSKIKPDMSSLAKQIEIHRYISEIKYPKEPFTDDHFTVIGALLNRSCVCEGYAKAYKLLCDRLGIASIVVLGEAIHPSGKKEAHAWNITRINGITAHTDTCWDSQYGISRYDYFNLSDADISADHSFDNTLYPNCEPNQINYFSKNKCIASNEAELLQIIEQKEKLPYFSVKLLFPYSIEKARFLPLNIGEIRYNSSQNIISYSKAMLE